MNAIALLLAALFGHVLLWTALVNRLHGTSLPRALLNAVTWLLFAWTLALPVGCGVWMFRRGIDPWVVREWFLASWPGTVYIGACWAAAVLGMVHWAGRRLLVRAPSVLRYHRSRLLGPLELAIVSPAPADRHHFLARLPGNQSLSLELAERALDVPRLDQALDGLTIAHLSDLHFTGRVGKAYFVEVVRLCNQTEHDLVVITGDLVDKADCMAWIPDTLGRLCARHGTYFVLGNHDRQVGAGRLRRTLGEAGLVDLGGRWLEREIRGVPVILAGNELPWFGPAADLSGAPPVRDGHGPLRIALSHSPDQLGWAQANDIDLLLAGHTHGGQIRLPLLGPILTPSRAGVKYAAGTFYAPPTIMHVSRGVSGEFPVRMNCPPEIIHLVLHAGG